MVGTQSEPDLDALSSWRATLEAQAESLRLEIGAKQAELGHVEQRLSLVTKLIDVETHAGTGRVATHMEGVSAASGAGDLAERSTTGDLEQAVEEILRAAGSPLHISKIREALVAGGFPIPGRGDDANIIVRLRRSEDRFTRTARGTYGLAEWGIPGLVSKSRRRRRASR